MFLEREERNREREGECLCLSEGHVTIRRTERRFGHSRTAGRRARAPLQGVCRGRRFSLEKIRGVLSQGLLAACLLFADDVQNQPNHPQPILAKDFYVAGVLEVLVGYLARRTWMSH
jgi:hypothetical protein